MNVVMQTMLIRVARVVASDPDPSISGTRAHVPVLSAIVPRF